MNSTMTNASKSNADKSPMTVRVGEKDKQSNLIYLHSTEDEQNTISANF